MRVSTCTNSSWYSMSVDRFPHQALHGTPRVLPIGLRTASPCDSMDADWSPYQTLHGTPWMLASSTDSVVDKNRYYASIHHVYRADQNCAVLKPAENIMRHVEMWSTVRKGTVRASVKHHKQRMVLASSLGCGLPDHGRLTFTLSGSGFITFACGAAHVIMSDDTETGKLW